MAACVHTPADRAHFASWRSRLKGLRWEALTDFCFEAVLMVVAGLVGVSSVSTPIPNSIRPVVGLSDHSFHIPRTGPLVYFSGLCF